MRTDHQAEVNNLTTFWSEYLAYFETEDSAFHRSKRRKVSEDSSAYEAISIHKSAATFHIDESLPWEDGECHRWHLEDDLVWSVESADERLVDCRTVNLLMQSRVWKVTCKLDDIVAKELLSQEELEEASLIARNQADKSDRGPGHLWTSVHLDLSRIEEGSACLKLEYEVFWNTTPSLSSIFVNPFAIGALRTYFPSKDDSEEVGSSPQDFFDSAHTPQQSNDSQLSIDGLLTELMPFQRSTVNWLLQRENPHLPSLSEAKHDQSPTARQNLKVEPSDHVEESFSQQSRDHGDLFSPEAIPWSFRAVKDSRGQIAFVSDILALITRDPYTYRQLETLKGGIIAEEMGLGKTVEVIALMLLHKRSMSTLDVPIKDDYIGKDVHPIGTTLIISPPSILDQWITEIKRHAPQLKVMNYLGVSRYLDMEQDKVISMLGENDVVLTTYSVLSKEVHWAQPPPDRSSRRKKVARAMSPLVRCSWWRICLDEAQMLESGVNAAAQVARLVPRVNAWAVTGTPVRKDIGDLLGFLTFLRLEPFTTSHYTNLRVQKRDSTIYWDRLIAQRECFKAIFGQLAIRHTKLQVREQLQIPGQQRSVITLPFTPIEEEYYQSLFREMKGVVRACYQRNSLPFRDIDDPSIPSEIMRGWLARLRQCALHPEIGAQNRHRLGRKSGPLRTVDEVLKAMLDHSNSSIMAKQRERLHCKVKRGQYYENSPRLEEAHGVWTECVEETQVLVVDSRKALNALRAQLQQEMVRLAAASGTSRTAIQDTSDDDDDEGEVLDESVRELQREIVSQRNKLRLLLEIKHVAVYYLANVYHQKGSGKWLPDLPSDEVKRYEELETTGYNLAQQVRQEILREISKKASHQMKRVTADVRSKTLVDVVKFHSAETLSDTTIEARAIVEMYRILIDTFNTQADQYEKWREDLVPLLTSSLLDEKSDADISGDEYIDSMKTQDQIMVILNVLRIVVEDRYELLTGQQNDLKRFETKTALKLAAEGEGPNPQLFIEMCQVRDTMKPHASTGSLRNVVAYFRGLVQALQADVAFGGMTGARASNQLAIVIPIQKEVHNLLSSQSKIIDKLRQENNVFTSLMNTRIEYFRELQAVSDQVGLPLADNIDERDWAIHDRLKQREVELDRLIDVELGRRRYLLNLKNSTEDASGVEAYRKCVICQDQIEIGTLTSCGHQFCKSCISMWYAAHKRCPTCNKYLVHADLHDISYKPQVLKVIEQPEVDPRKTKGGSNNHSNIYSEMNQDTLSGIQNTELPGPSYTTKINVISRHILYLRENDPGAKSIIFSQFKDFLDVLSHAFKAHQIGFSSISQAHGIDKFKSDPSIEVFLLHGKAQSSGLNLVNASHVFLCEPLINTALELQAIARVDRIGQRAKTNVYLYLIENTVEEAIHRISVQRRMRYFGQNKRDPAAHNEAGVEDDVELGNSLELQKAPLQKALTAGTSGGEWVPKEDLFRCLFGNMSVEELDKNEDAEYNDEDLPPPAPPGTRVRQVI